MFIPLGDDVEKRNLPVASILLMAACSLAFLQTIKVGLADPGNKAMHEFLTQWGLVPTDLAKGRYIGLLTHMFLHAGLSHLLGNLIVFWAFAPTLEDTLGSLHFLVLYLVWGLAGALAQTWVSWGETIPLVGASGAIAGVIGAYCVNYGALTNIRTLIWIVYPMKTQIPACVYVLLWMASQVYGLMGAEEGGPGIAWAAHVGGFAVGSVTMMIVGSRTKRRLVERHGVLHLEDVGAETSVDAQLAYDVSLGSAAAACPQCGTSVEGAHKLGENLLRCPNPACARLVYLEDANVAAG